MTWGDRGGELSTGNRRSGKGSQSMAVKEDGWSKTRHCKDRWSTVRTGGELQGRVVHYEAELGAESGGGPCVLSLTVEEFVCPSSTAVPRTLIEGLDYKTQRSPSDHTAARGGGAYSETLATAVSLLGRWRL